MKMRTVLRQAFFTAVGFTGRVIVGFGIVAFILIIVTALILRSQRKKGDDALHIALITGASSGLGAAFAREIVRKEKGIDAIWLIARRKERLDALAEELESKGMAAKVLPLDLTKPESYTVLKNKLENSGVRVRILIPCAGLGKIGAAADMAPKDADAMIDLNDRAAVDTTAAVLPFMDKGSRILEICSTAAFQPLPHFAVYAASKVMLYHYSRALRTELLPRGIAVTAVCPYWMADTEFIPIAKAAENVGEKPEIKNFAGGAKSTSVARRALATSRRGFAVSTPGAFCTIHRFFSKLIPREVLIAFWELLRRL